MGITIMDVQSLRRSLEGSVVHRRDAAYEAMRQSMSWNALTPARYPTAIVQVASAADVIAAVRFAREHRLPIAVRGGGHSWCGTPLREGTLLLDLSRLDHVAVDVETRRAQVQPVVRNRALDRQLAPHGLAFPYGHCSTVALSGYLLSGGFGWNMGQWGPACFSVEAVDVVTANADLVTATATQHSDILWAVRGAGAAFFGIVTRYELALHPRPGAIMTSTFVYPLECAPALAGWASTRIASRSPRVEVVLALTRAPAHVASRCGNDGGMACTLVATAFAETEDDGRALLAPLDNWEGIARCLERVPYRSASFDALFDDMDALFPPRHRYLADTFGSDRGVDELMALVLPHVRRAPSPRSLVLCPIIPPPAGNAPAPPAAAFSINPRSFVIPYAIWDNAGADAINRAWHDAIVQTLEDAASCHYIGESDIAARPQRTAKSFAPTTWERLQKLRKEHDPDGLIQGVFAERVQ